MLVLGAPCTPRTHSQLPTCSASDHCHLGLGGRLGVGTESLRWDAGGVSEGPPEGA